MSNESASPRIKIRIEGLSDIVFGLALSIGSLVLISNFPKTPNDLGAGILLFAFSFFIVIFSWVGYTRTMTVLPVEVRGAFIINIVLLLCVALEPYLFYVLFQTQNDLLLYWASVAYAVDVGAIFLMLAGLCYVLIQESKRPQTELKVHPSVVEKFRRAMKAQMIIGGIFLVSALPLFWVQTPVGYLRFFLWDASIPAFILWIPYQRRKVSEAGPVTS